MKNAKKNEAPREKGERLARKRLEEHETDLFGHWWPFDESFKKLATLCAFLPLCVVLLQMDKKNTWPVDLLWRLAGVFAIGCLVMLTLCVVSDYFAWKRRRRFFLKKAREGESASLNDGRPLRAASMSFDNWIRVDAELRAALARFGEARLLDAEASAGATRTRAGQREFAEAGAGNAEEGEPRTEKRRLGARRI